MTDQLDLQSKVTTMLLRALRYPSSFTEGQLQIMRELVVALNGTKSQDSLEDWM